MPGGHLMALSQPEELASRILWRGYRGSPMDIEQILRETRTVAIVGASANPRGPATRSGQIPEVASDYELYLVNPTISEVDGTPVYPLTGRPARRT